MICIAVRLTPRQTSSAGRPPKILPAVRFKAHSTQGPPLGGRFSRNPVHRSDSAGVQGLGTSSPRGLRQEADLHAPICHVTDYSYFCTMSYTSLTYHLVFGTYRRMPVINHEHEKELYKYMFDYSSAHGIYVRRIGGMPDHVHILCDIPAKIAVASFVQTLKAESSKFMQVNSHFPAWTTWAEGYGAFSVDASSRETKRKYI